MSSTVITRSQRDLLYRHFSELFEAQRFAIREPADEPPNPDLIGICCSVLGEIDVSPRDQYDLTLSREVVDHLEVHADICRDRARAWSKRPATIRSCEIASAEEGLANAMYSLVGAAEAV